MAPDATASRPALRVVRCEEASAPAVLEALPGNPLLQAILDAPLPSVVNRSIRREPRKEIAAAVRKVLKSMGIKGVSVTTPSYSMASGIDVRIPRAAQHPSHDRSETWKEDYASCPLCQQHTFAVNRIEKIILAAFPDLGDRSDYQSDYHDNPLSIS